VEKFFGWRRDAADQIEVAVGMGEISSKPSDLGSDRGVVGDVGSKTAPLKIARVRHPNA
jgi:hypothetical protein